MREKEERERKALFFLFKFSTIALMKKMCVGVVDFILLYRPYIHG